MTRLGSRGHRGVTGFSTEGGGGGRCRAASDVPKCETGDRWRLLLRRVSSPDPEFFPTEANRTGITVTQASWTLPKACLRILRRPLLVGSLAAVTSLPDTGLHAQGVTTVAIGG